MTLPNFRTPEPSLALRGPGALRLRLRDVDLCGPGHFRGGPGSARPAGRLPRRARGRSPARGAWRRAFFRSASAGVGAAVWVLAPGSSASVPSSMPRCARGLSSELRPGRGHRARGRVIGDFFGSQRCSIPCQPAVPLRPRIGVGPGVVRRGSSYRASSAPLAP